MEERGRIEAFALELATSLDADRSDLGRVSPWMKPVVIARGVCARAVLRHRRAAAERALSRRYETLGALAASTARGESAEVAGSRAALERLRAERERRLAAFGETAHPAWAVTAAAESAGLARAVLGQLRSALMPKAPALAGMAVGWWIANTYTDSHLRSALRSVGIGHGGTHVVERLHLQGDELLAAAACGWCVRVSRRTTGPALPSAAGAERIHLSQASQRFDKVTQEAGADRSGDWVCISCQCRPEVAACRMLFQPSRPGLCRCRSF